METAPFPNMVPARAFSLDPRTKLFLTLTMPAILISSERHGIMGIVQLCLAVIPFVFFILSKRPGTAFKYLALYAFAYVLPEIFLSSTTGILNSLLIGLAGLVTRLLPGLLMGYFLITTTTVSEFSAAMDRMHVTRKIAIPISVMFRFLPTIKEEYRSIKDAMRMREIQSARNPIAMLEYRFVPLLMSVVGIGGELAASALSRGLGAPIKRTNICNIGFRGIDIVLLAGCILCWSLFGLSLGNVL